MPDAIQPVGAMIQPPNPLAGINAYSSILGLKQQQLGIQAQEQGLAGQAAEVQQAQQRNSELQALHQFTSDAVHDPQYQNADGSLNVTKFQQDAMRVAPVYGSQYIGQITANASGAVDNREAMLKLSNEQRATIANYLSAVAQKPGATTQDLLEAVKKVRSVSDDPGYQSAVDYMLMHSPQTIALPSDQASAVIRKFTGIAAQRIASDASRSAPVSTQTAGGGSGSGPTLGQLPTTSDAPPPIGEAAPLDTQELDRLRLTSQMAGNPANAPQYAGYTGPDSRTRYAQVNPNAPGGMRPDIGTSLPQGMTVSERYSIQPGPSGQLMLTDRQSGRVIPLGGTSGAATGGNRVPAFGSSIGAPGGPTADTDPQKPGPNDPAWRQAAYGDQVQRAAHDVRTAQDMDANYGSNMATADMIRHLSNDVKSGPGTSAWTHALGVIGSRFGAQNVADTQTLASFLDLQSARLRDSMGLPATNAGLATSQEMGTSIESQREAIQAKTDYYQALTELQHRYRTGLDAAGNGGVNASPTAVSKFKSAFAANADPIAMEIELAQRRGDTAAAQRVLGGLSAKQRKLVHFSSACRTRL